jgi:hypothetical protein
MKNAKRLYNALLNRYPHRYRKEFGAQMMRTFIDHYQDVQKSEGRVGMSFWFSAIADEISNITQQHLTSLMEENSFLKVTASKLMVSALLFLPLYAVLYAIIVRASLALPHPPLSGSGVTIALTAILLFPSVVSAAGSYVLASALASIFYCAQQKMLKSL